MDASAYRSSLAAHRVRQGTLACGGLLEGPALLAEVGQQPLLVEGDREQGGPVVEPVPCARGARLHGAVDREQAPVAAAERHGHDERQLVRADRARARQRRRRELARGGPHPDEPRQGAGGVVHADDLHLPVTRPTVGAEPEAQARVPSHAPRQPAERPRAGSVAAQQVHVDLVLVDDRALQLPAARQHRPCAAPRHREQDLGDGTPDRRLVLRVGERFHDVGLHAAQAGDQLLEGLGVRLHRGGHVGQPGQAGGGRRRAALGGGLDGLHHRVPPRLARCDTGATSTADTRRTDERRPGERTQDLVAAPAAAA